MYWIVILLGLLVLGVIYSAYERKKRNHREEELLKDRVAYLHYLQKEIREEADLSKEKAAHIIYNLFEDSTVYTLYINKDYIALKEGIRDYADHVRSKDGDVETEYEKDIEKMHQMKESLRESLEDDGVQGILRDHSKDKKRYEEDLKYFIYFNESGIF